VLGAVETAGQGEQFHNAVAGPAMGRISVLIGVSWWVKALGVFDGPDRKQALR
jgi:hypothetical protein